MQGCDGCSRQMREEEKQITDLGGVVNRRENIHYYNSTLDQVYHGNMFHSWNKTGVKYLKMFHMGNNIIGKRVKIARTRIKPKMTQSDLAAKLQVAGWDIDRAGIAKIEIGLRQVTDIEALQLAKALNVSVAWLFEASNPTGQTG